MSGFLIQHMGVMPVSIYTHSMDQIGMSVRARIALEGANTQMTCADTFKNGKIRGGRPLSTAE